MRSLKLTSSYLIRAEAGWKVVSRNSDKANSIDASNDGHLSQDINYNSAVRLEEHLEVISTDDARIKIIGEELANETGRAIFTRICQATTSPAELAKSLDISLPLVNWHLNRMMGVGLIRIDRIGMSSKNRGMKYYAPTKTVLVIVPPRDQIDASRAGQIEKLIEKLTKHLTGIVCFVVGTSVFFLVRSLLEVNGGGIQLGDPEESVGLIMWQMFLLPLLGGIAAGVTVNFAMRIAQRIRRLKK
jgi:DNA-binding transcriptional ArsR family regulator